jgi:hypothetical protein
MRSLRHHPGRVTPPSGCCTPDATDGTGLDALARVLAAYEPERLTGRGTARKADRALRAAARRLAAEARVQDATRAERLLLELRRAWRELPAVRQLPDDGARRALWDRLVLLCCEEFYAPGRASAGPDAASDTAPQVARPSLASLRSPGGPPARSSVP